MHGSRACSKPPAGPLHPHLSPRQVFESSVGIGPYIECAFFHKKSRTLLVTDAVISVSNTPPEVRLQWGSSGAAQHCCAQPYAAGTTQAG